jgi:hypothetical protein
MKATIISNPDDIPKIKTEAVIISFRPSFDDILAIADKKVKLIQINQATSNSLSKNSRNILNYHGIKLQIGNIQGLKKETINI